nr:uncharacterized protein LOC109154045 [Ipomoea batatas]
MKALQFVEGKLYSSTYVMGYREQDLSGNGGGFTLSLRHGGRINKTKSSYVGGKICSFQNMDVNEWGLFTLRDKLKEIGYEMVEQLKMFGSMSNGLIELVTDCEAWDIVKQIELHNAIVIWVVSDDGVDECEDAFSN